MGRPESCRLVGRRPAAGVHDDPAVGELDGAGVHPPGRPRLPVRWSRTPSTEQRFARSGGRSRGGLRRVPESPRRRSSAVRRSSRHIKSHAKSSARSRHGRGTAAPAPDNGSSRRVCVRAQPPSSKAVYPRLDLRDHHADLVEEAVRPFLSGFESERIKRMSGLTRVPRRMPVPESCRSSPTSPHSRQSADGAGFSALQALLTTVDRLWQLGHLDLVEVGNWPSILLCLFFERPRPRVARVWGQHRKVVNPGSPLVPFRALCREAA